MREAPRAIEDGICTLDMRGSDAVDRARIWARDAHSHRWGVSEALGLYPTAAVKRAY